VGEKATRVGSIHRRFPQAQPPLPEKSLRVGSRVPPTSAVAHQVDGPPPANASRPLPPTVPTDVDGLPPASASSVAAVVPSFGQPMRGVYGLGGGGGHDWDKGAAV